MVKINSEISVASGQYLSQWSIGESIIESIIRDVQFCFSSFSFFLSFIGSKSTGEELVNWNDSGGCGSVVRYQLERTIEERRLSQFLEPVDRLLTNKTTNQILVYQVTKVPASVPSHELNERRANDASGVNAEKLFHRSAVKWYVKNFFPFNLSRLLIYFFHSFF